MPDYQSHQIAAMTDESSADTFDADRCSTIPRLKFQKKTTLVKLLEQIWSKFQKISLSDI